MKRIVQISLLAIAIFAFSGCGEKQYTSVNYPKTEKTQKIHNGDTIVKHIEGEGVYVYIYKGVELRKIGLGDSLYCPLQKRKYKTISCVNKDFIKKHKLRKSFVSQDDHSFVSELLYQGIDGDTLKITYREFIGNLVRPAFFQNLTYNLNKDKPTIINYKSIKIKVYEATNNYIKYEVLSYQDK
jgi:hypothetical protein